LETLLTINTLGSRRHSYLYINSPDGAFGVISVQRAVSQNNDAVCFWQPIPFGLNLVVVALLRGRLLCVV